MRTRITGNIIFFIFILTGFAFQGFAQQTFNFAVIDSQKAFESSVEGKKAIALLREKEQKIKDELAKLDNKSQALETKLNTQKLTLSFEAQQQLALDLDSIRTKHRRLEEDSTKEFRQLQFRLFSKVSSEVLPIIENIAKEKGLSIVFDLSTTGVAYVHPNFDITEEVIKRYNASKIPKK